MKTRTGFVGLIGRPNVGKSSFLNAVLGNKVSIVSSRLQTTRHKISGIFNYSEKPGQIVFLDLPGVCEAFDELGKTCSLAWQKGIREADCLLFFVDSSVEIGEGDVQIADWITDNMKDKPVLLVWSKSDLLKGSPLPASKKKLPMHLHLAKTSHQISSVSSQGITELLDAIWDNLPEGEFYFPEEYLTDRSERFLVGELIREQVLRLTFDEIPHATAVLIEGFIEEEKLHRITAKIILERESQKAIVIGKDGRKIKQICTNARKEIENLLDKKVYLDLKVKVYPKWRKNRSKLRELGYES